METIKIRVLSDGFQVKFEKSKGPLKDINKFIQYKVGPKKQSKYISDHYQIELKKIPALMINDIKFIGLEIWETNRIGAEMHFSYFHVTRLTDDSQTIYNHIDKTFINKTKIKALAYKLEKYLVSLGYPIEVELVNNRYKFAEENIYQHYEKGWHHKEHYGVEKTLKEIADSYCEAEKKNSRDLLDKNKKPLINGELKYFRDYKGHLRRGEIYHNLNNMFWVITDKYSYTNKANFDLFDISEDTILKRYRPRSRKSIISSLETEYSSYDNEITELSKKFKDPYSNIDKVQKRFDELHEIKRKIIIRIKTLSSKLEILDIEEFKKYRDNIEKNNSYYHFNKEIIEKILETNPDKVTNDELRTLIQLAYPNRMIASGLFQPILIFKIKDGKRIDPPLEAYDKINTLIPNVLKEAKKIYKIINIHENWENIKENNND